MHMTGFRTHRQVRQARRKFAARFPHMQTREDREAAQRMDGLVYAVFLALAVIPAVALIIDYAAGGDWVRTIIAAVYQWGPL